ncbi:small ribosomal subunit protein bS1m [Cryptomeria japonica]|uniref:small ribosomal subunit protein bS1m n=1 Tax=Cryptomeria japonica TaxID=3369 RepID=UPI0027DA41AC|nr:small ribosomal subunit protein bS1m [Cryptomeria japonica]XP_057870273.2 small ribosomal subunit protein bS1m [Cryptomeria japonica]XP_057870274.2 small ribosomal subunit protein bS1m [Cryptomeria japonica]XP_057870275.2 small ribosomal subunit protein bS1m [Cryptomeria japonica]
MSSQFGRLFQKSNSSVSLQCGNALQSSVVRLRDKIFLLDAGLAAPVACTHDELTRVPANHNARFINRIGYLDVAGGNSRSAAGLSKAGLADVKMGGQLPGSKILERLFVDIVAGDQVAKSRATMRLNEMVGFADSVPGEPQIISPYKFRQHRAWIELNKYWRRNRKVQGVVLGKVNRGYAVAISGFVAFLPQSLGRNKRIVDKFVIDELNSKSMNFVVK